MSTLTRAYSEVSGTVAFASSVNRVVDDCVSTINALNSANIITSGVDFVNINACAVITVKVQDSGVTTIKIDDSAVTHSKTDETIALMGQMFGG